MLLRLPNNLHYPITLTKISAKPGDSISPSQDLFLYTYATKVKQGTRYGGDDPDTEVDKIFPAKFQSTLGGVVRRWRVWEGDTFVGPVDVCEIEEECLHTVQFQGMCTNCGRDMTELSAGREGTDADRAPIRMAHDTQFLTISQEEAREIDEEGKRRLLASRKLSLVVDLDQTIIHAAVDTTIDEWMKDETNPNHEAVRDVRKFQLVDDGPGMRGCWYFIKLRPGLEQFLESVSKLYELHIYTMGTRQYAQQIANIIDPERKIFGERILSRDESGSMVAKNLERLFPVDTKMVVIIDDRGDVWNWSANLLRVTPFEFFVGIGDINSSFLPKRDEVPKDLPAEGAALPDVEAAFSAAAAAASGEEPDKSMVNGVADDGTSVIQNGTAALENLIAMSGGDDPVIRELQSKEQEEVISSQLEDKPLLKMQQKQDEEDELAAAANAAAATADVLLAGNGEVQASTHVATASDSTESDSSQPGDASVSPNPPPKAPPRHSILKNDDAELIYVEHSLTNIHTVFFADYDRKRLATKGGRVAALAGNKRKMPFPPQSSSSDAVGDEPSSASDLLLVPDIKRVMPAMKLKVLSGVVLCFSGVLPLGTDVQKADISVWARTFGARITERVSRDVTHVIARRAGTAKVKLAVKRGVRVVGLGWLVECMRRWTRVGEGGWRVEGVDDQGHDDDAMNGADGDAGDGDEKSAEQERVGAGSANEFLLSSSEIEDDDEGEETTGMDELETDNDEDHGGEHSAGPARKKLKLDTSTSKTDVKSRRPANISTGADANSTPNLATTANPNTNTIPDPDEPNNESIMLDNDGDGGAISPTLTINQDEWDDIDAELKEFMDGSDVESESDAESVNSRLSIRGRKRKKAGDGVGGDGGDTLKADSKTTSKDDGNEDGAVQGANTNGGEDDHKGRERMNELKEQAQLEAAEQAEEAEAEDSDDELARELEREMEEADAEDGL